MLKQLSVTVALALCLSWGVAAFAPTDADARPSRRQLREAEAHAKQAKEHFRNNRFEEAADLFMKVYRLSKKVTAVFNAARCKEMAGRLGEARSLFELYLSISDNEAGKADAREHLVDIARRLEQQRQAEEKRRKEETARAAQEAEARKKAEAAAQQAQQAQREAEQRAKAAEAQRQKAAQQAEAAKKAAAAKKAEPPKKLSGVIVLPPVGVAGGDLAIAASTALRLVTGEATDARIGKVLTVADYNTAETTRGVVGGCDFPCRLGVARSLGARWAIATTVREKAGTMQLQSVLWRTVDMAQDGVVKVQAPTLKQAQTGYENAVGDLFNKVRIFPLAEVRPVRPMQPVPGQVPPAMVDVFSQPQGAQLWVDGKLAGSCPRKAQLPQGWHRLQVRASGHRDRGGLIYVRSGRWYRLSIVQPKRLPPPRPVAIPSPGKPAHRAPAATPGSGANKTATAHPPAPGAHPPAAGATTWRDRNNAGDPRSARRTNENRGRTRQKADFAGKQRRSDNGGNSTVTLPGTGGIWGLAVFGSAAIAGMAPRTPTDEGGADISFGGGGFAHWGYATSTAPFVPWFSFLAGLKYNAYQGLYRDAGGTAPVAGPEVFAGIAFPRFWGVTLGIHKHWVNNALSEDLHGFTMWSLGILRTKEWIFFRLAYESRISSERSIGLDAFGEGPTGRLIFELGVNFGGVQFSR